MFAKIVVFCTVLAASQAGLVGPMGLGTSMLSTGSLGMRGIIGKVASPATVSMQNSVISHIAPAARIAVGHGMIGNGLIGNGLIGNGLIGNGVIGNGIIRNGLIGNGMMTNGLGASVVAAGPLGLNGIIGKQLVAAPVTISKQNSVINHVAPVAVVGHGSRLVGNGLIGNGLIGNGLISNGLIGNGLMKTGVIGNGLIGNGLIGNGLIGNGLIGNGLVRNGLVTPMLTAGPVGIGGINSQAIASSQKSVINHVAPVAAVAPVIGHRVIGNGILGNGIISGQGTGSGLLGIGPMRVGKLGMGAPLGLGLGVGKVLL